MKVQRFLLLGLAVLFPQWTANATELPWWVDSVTVSPPGFGGIGAVTLEGVWRDTGAPDAISHSYTDTALHLTVSAPGLNVATGDALTPWTLTEEFGPLPGSTTNELINNISGSVYLVDPNNRGLRELVSGPDRLGYLIPPPQGEFHGLGALGSPTYVSAAFDVSADGRVVTGHNQTAPGVAALVTSEAFAWSPQTGMVSLGLLPGGSPGGSTGLGVSAEGNYIVGGSSTSNSQYNDYEAFRWSLGGGMESLGTINQFSSTSSAAAVSRFGRVVVGTDEFSPPTLPPIADVPQQRAFRYTDESGMQDLGLLESYGSYSTTEAIDVTPDGEVIVGTARRVANSLAFEYHIDQSQPFLWTEETGMVGLGNLPRFFPAIFPTPQQETIANAVSADGAVVVGEDRVIPSAVTDAYYPYESSAVLWTREQGWIDLGGFEVGPGPEFAGAVAVDVSGTGDTVIGEALIDSIDAAGSSVETIAGDLRGRVDEYGRLSVPFIWDERRGMRPLARVLAGDFGLDFEGWVLDEATAISDDGTTIVGTGINPDGEQEAWRAVMYRNSREGDLDFDGDVDTDDAALMRENLGMSGEVYYDYGDLDGDGTVSADDLALLQANYDYRSFGDFNADGEVNAADYSLWRDAQGEESGLADSNGDGFVDEEDLIAWQANHGHSVAALTVAIPEPAGGLLAVSLAATALLGWHRQ